VRDQFGGHIDRGLLVDRYRGDRRGELGDQLRKELLGMLPGFRQHRANHISPCESQLSHGQVGLVRAGGSHDVSAQSCPCGSQLVSWCTSRLSDTE
jgi:hypothetical protein